MAVYSARQSSYSDNDVITAAHSNDEFNAILAAFNHSTGHVHDGTAGGGSPIVKLGPSQDVLITAALLYPKTDDTVDLGTSTLENKDLYIDGVAYIDGLGEDLLVATDKKIQFRDTGLYISSNADGDLDIVSDGTAVDSINLESAGGITLDAGTAGSGIVYEDDGTEMARLYNSSSDVILETKVSDKDFLIKGNDGGSTITAMTIDMSAAGAVTFNDKITAVGTSVFTDLDISGDVDVDGTLEADALTINSTPLAEVIADTVGAMVGSNTETGITVTYEDGDNTLDFVIGTLNQDTTGTADNITVSANNSADETVYPIFVDGATGSQGAESDTGFTYNPSSGNLTIGGELSAASLDISGNVDVDGTLEADAITVDGTTLATYIRDTVGTNMLSSNTESGITVTYDTSNDNIDFAVDAAQTGITSVVNASLELGRDADNRIKFGTDNQIIFEVDGGDNVIFKTSGEIEATSLDISGDADIDGTLEADAITVGGTALNTVIAGVTVTNATTAAVATTVTISDNESTDEDNAIIFTSGADVDGGNIGLESDGDLTYNPSTGRLTATQLSGTIQTAAQTNITSLGTLSALTVDNVAINGTTIGHTDDTDLITLADGIATVAGEISVTTLDIGGTNVAATAAELNIMDGGTAASATTLADADRLVTNDDGTMKQVALTDVKTYLSSAGFATDDPTALAIALG